DPRRTGAGRLAACGDPARLGGLPQHARRGGRAAGPRPGGRRRPRPRESRHAASTAGVTGSTPCTADMDGPTCELSLTGVTPSSSLWPKCRGNGAAAADDDVYGGCAMKRSRTGPLTIGVSAAAGALVAALLIPTAADAAPPVQLEV